MPEIIEICVTSQFLSQELLNGKLQQIEILGGKYKRYGSPERTNEINSKCPYEIKEISSKGKLMFIKLFDSINNETYYMTNSFGLEGRWSFTEVNHANVKLVVQKDNKTINVYFVDHRNFGNISFLTPSEFQTKLDSMGPDFLKEPFTEQEFHDRCKKFLILNKKSKPKKIVKVLMTQTAKDGLGSGLGNYLVPEILYRSKISPHTTINDIVDNQNIIFELSKTIKYVLKLCYLTNETGYMIYIKDYLPIHKKMVLSGELPNYYPEIDIKNNKFDFMVYRQKTDLDGNDVTREEIIKGRNTYWVKNIQVN